MPANLVAAVVREAFARVRLVLSKEASLSRLVREAQGLIQVARMEGQEAIVYSTP